jgi:16S rRNA (cytosine967-C5)-methyltransferase
LDRIIEEASQRSLKTLQPAVIDLLRLGSQRLLLQRTIPAIAVSSSVDLAHRRIGQRVTGLVNAILRRVAELSWPEWLDRLSADLDPVAALALRTCHPQWIAQSYIDLLGFSEAELALMANNQPPRTVLALRPGLVALSDLLADGAQPGRWSPYAVTIDGDPAAWPALAAGLVAVQDEGSQLVSLGLARPPAPSGHWLDLCAGPGGKTALLAGLAAEHGQMVLASELHWHRAQLVRQAVRAYPRPPVVVVADGRQPPWQPNRFARVLADVPCSGLGALRRRPEARWRKSAADLPALIELQTELLETALEAVAVGGVVVYATCSPLRQESAAVVEMVLRRQPAIQLIPAGQVWPEIADAQSGPYLQLWPHRHGTDAMFAAVLRRAKLTG